MAPERIKSVACVATVQPLLPTATYPPRALPIGSRCETRDRTASIEALMLPYVARLNRPAIALSSASNKDRQSLQVVDGERCDSSLASASRYREEAGIGWIEAIQLGGDLGDASLGICA